MPNNHSDLFAHLRAVIFDYGEVLCHRPSAAEMNKLAGFFGFPKDGFIQMWEKNRGPFDRGDLTPEKYWTMLANDAGTKIGAKELEQICALDLGMWSNINDNMIEWVHRLRASGLKVGLLSNMHQEMVTHCRKQFEWINNFDFVTFSAETRMIKPDAAIYEHTLRGLGVSADHALFLDDREVNIQAAKALGIHAIRVQSMPQLRSDLKAAGFTMLPEES
jgi:putative hydrolase of the HAD superfamily